MLDKRQAVGRLKKRSSPAGLSVNGKAAGLYECGRCQLRFSRNKTLARHLESVHQEKTTHSCEFCNKRFLQDGRRSLHERSVHWRELGLHCKPKGEGGHCCQQSWGLAVFFNFFTNEKSF